jgi:hypothetical protein
MRGAWLALVAACDPGHHMVPDKWKLVGSGRYEQVIDGVRVQTGVIGGLAGEAFVETTIAFPDAHEITVKRIVLDGPLGSRDGKLRVDRTSVAGWWEFSRDATLPRILGDRARIVLDAQVDGSDHTLSIPYVKENR